jgi:hypothetical protein
MNHTNRSVSGREGKLFAEKIMSALAGRVGTRINGEIVQWNSLKSKSRLHVGDDSIPVGELPSHLTAHEREELDSLPFWNGNNDYEISSTCLILVRAAIKRYMGPDHGSDRFPPRFPVEEQKQELWQSSCHACTANRSNDQSS